MGIREDLRLSILVPMSFGFILASLLATGLMGFWVLRWPDLYKEEVIAVEQSNLRDISSSLAGVFTQFSGTVSCGI